MKLARLYWLTSLAATALFCSPNAWSTDQIIKPYQSVRSSGMGGLKLTTGLYDENFFGNPARVLANPTWRVTLFDPMIETSTSTLSNLNELSSGSGDVLSRIGNTAGKVNHGRIQLTTPSVYIAKGERKWALAVGLITSVQFDVALRNSYQISPMAIADIGPALTYGRTFFEDERLAVGITPHFTSRIATSSQFTMADLISGKSLSPSETGGAGSHLDVDLGSTYRLPWTYREFRFDSALAMNNLLGGRYSNLGSLIDAQALPRAQPRTLGFGIAARRDTWGAFKDTVFAFEVQDIGNNPQGSLFRLLHLGGESRWRRLALRLGLNQGYWTGGLGIDLSALTLDLATYGEEMSLNAGGSQSRRYALKLAFQI
ncbi:MAG: hypothetical protein RJB38_1505 [Pseudomonadota bacterium]|jgi:hypothetical protein